MTSVNHQVDLFKLWKYSDTLLINIVKSLSKINLIPKHPLQWTSDIFDIWLSGFNVLTSEQSGQKLITGSIWRSCWGEVLDVRVDVWLWGGGKGDQGRGGFGVVLAAKQLPPLKGGFCNHFIATIKAMLERYTLIPNVLQCHGQVSDSCWTVKSLSLIDKI